MTTPSTARRNAYSSSTCQDEVPPSWTCNRIFYDALDGCDCDCGAHDPDCNVAGQSLYCDEIPAPAGTVAVVLRLDALRGCVLLVDSPDLHLATAEHAGFLDRLAALARGNQLIVATGSDAIVQGHAPNVVATLRRGSGR